MKDLQPRKGRIYIDRLVAQGEHENQDFKYIIPDVRKIARSISAFSNTTGGRLLIGVKDNGTVAGVRNEEDVYVVEQAAQRYCVPPCDVEFSAYRYDAGVVVIQASIAAAPTWMRPVRVVEEDGKQRAYLRVADENLAAPDVMERAWEISASDTPASLDPEFLRQSASLIDLLRKDEVLDPDRVQYLLHLPRARASELTARLLAMGLLDLRHTSQRFLLALPPDQS